MSDDRGSNSPNNFMRFEEVDKLLAGMDISSEERMKIYSVLAAILHLGNVIIEENVSEDKCVISNLSVGHFENAARLLNIDQHTLETALLTRTIEVNGLDPIM